MIKTKAFTHTPLKLRRIKVASPARQTMSRSTGYQTMSLSNGSRFSTLSNGFTIVELLVVIVIIGVLAAITVVVYTGISQKAIIASLQSDLVSAKKQLALYYVDNESFPIDLNTSNCPRNSALIVDTRYCLKISSGNSYTYTPAASTSPQTYTLDATNTNNTKYRITNSTSPVDVATTPIAAIAAITGTTTVGSVLTAGALTPSGATVTYQWQSAATSGGTYTNISGATASTYMLVAGDLGMYIKVVATGTGNYVNNVTSTYSTKVTNQLNISAPTLILSKPYDGNTSAIVTAGVLSGVLGADVVNVSAVSSYDTSTVGGSKTITTVYTLSGAQAGNYIKPNNDSNTAGIITKCIGGLQTFDGLYSVHTFTASTTLVCGTNSSSADVMVVGGGGGGGGSFGGGGGAGGYLSGTQAISGNMAVTVGNGGLGVIFDNKTKGGNGGSSVFGTRTAIGGGGGGTTDWAVQASFSFGAVGGSGGGGAYNWGTGASGTAGQGFKGGDASGGGGGFGGGGGGGASAAGSYMTGNPGGPGGAGINSDIVKRGTNVCYAGGGNGGSGTYATCGGGQGSGGNGTSNTGGGGAGGAYSNGGNGGSGIIVIRYLTAI